MHDSSTNDRLPLTRLWWLHPFWPLAIIVGVTITIALLQSPSAYDLYGTPKFLTPVHGVIALAAVLSFGLGCWWADATGRKPAASAPTAAPMVRKWFYGTLALTAFGYAAWLASGIKNGFRPAMLVEILFTSDSSFAYEMRHEIFTTIPGLTTCSQFAVPAMLLGLWLYWQGDRRVLFPLCALLAVAAARALLFSERSALIEVLLPGVILALRTFLIDRSVPRWLYRGLQSAPLVAPLAVVLFFGSFEYFRSWRYYQDEFDSFPEFTVWRLGGYFTVALNNAALAMETDAPRPLPFYTLKQLWEFPGLDKTPLAYHRLTGFVMEEAHMRMLARYGTDELNSEGGIFQPALDFGHAGGLLYWFGFGFIAARLHRGFIAGTLAGLTLYPIVFIALLEVPLILYLCHPRIFPALATLLLVSWLTSGSRAAALATASSDETVTSNPPLLEIAQ